MTRKSRYKQGVAIAFPTSTPPLPSEVFNSGIANSQPRCLRVVIYDDTGSEDVEDGADAEGVDPGGAEPEDAPPWD